MGILTSKATFSSNQSTRSTQSPQSPAPTETESLEAVETVKTGKTGETGKTYHESRRPEIWRLTPGKSRGPAAGRRAHHGDPQARPRHRRRGLCHRPRRQPLRHRYADGIEAGDRQPHRP